MPPVLEKPETRTDWFEEICQQLDALRHDAHEYREESDIIPQDEAFEIVKQAFQDLRRLADFPKLPKAHVWLGPEGQIGITWKYKGNSLDLIFGQKFTARLTELGVQKLLAPKDVPTALSRIAA